MLNRLLSCLVLPFLLACESNSNSSSATNDELSDDGTNGPDECPLGRSDGCCFGDGECCPCVLGCDPDTSFNQDPETDAFIACVCEDDACQVQCENECAGSGIGDDCEPCATQIGICMDELSACAGSGDGDGDGEP